MSSESQSTGGGLFNKLKDSARQAASQAQTIYHQQAERYHQSAGGDPFSSPTSGTHDGSPASKPGFSLSDVRDMAIRYNPNQSPYTMKLQMTIKGKKAIVSAHETLAKDHKAYAKTLFQYTQESDAIPDVKDIGDRLAWLEFKQGELQADFAAKVEQSRAALKDIRSYEDKLKPNRDKRQELKTRLSTLHEKQAEAVKIEAVQHELDTLINNDATYEASIRSLKRQKLAESYELEFSALKELGEKLSVLAGYGQVLVQGLKNGGPNPSYSGFGQSEQIKLATEQALNSYARSSPLIPLPVVPTNTALARNNTTDSFGSTHAKELAEVAHTTVTSSPQIAASNISPPPLRAQLSPPSLPPSTAATVPTPIREDSELDYETPVGALPEPTVIETGQPLMGTNGPAEGQLKPRRPSNPADRVSIPKVLGQAAPAVSPRHPASNAKEEEHRQEVEENWRRINEGPSLTTNTAPNAGTSGLERNDTRMSRIGPSGEALPAYTES